MTQSDTSYFTESSQSQSADKEAPEYMCNATTIYHLHCHGPESLWISRLCDTFVRFFVQWRVLMFDLTASSVKNFALVGLKFPLELPPVTHQPQSNSKNKPSIAGHLLCAPNYYARRSIGLQPI